MSDEAQPAQPPHAERLPLYRSHKTVRAAKIVRVFETGRRLALDVAGAELDVSVPANFFARGAPAIGDWYILYPDGYESWSPAQAFVDGYTLLSV